MADRQSTSDQAAIAAWLAEHVPTQLAGSAAAGARDLARGGIFDEAVWFAMVKSSPAPRASDYRGKKCRRQGK